MSHDTNNHTSLKEIEQELFGRLQHYFHVVFKRLLEDMDGWIMENRDYARYKYKEKQETSMVTVFGSIAINRRKYQDREKGTRVALLDQYFPFKRDDSLRPFKDGSGICSIHRAARIREDSWGRRGIGETPECVSTRRLTSRPRKA